MKALCTATLALIFLSVLHAEDKPKTALKPANSPVIVKTEEEWKKLLTDDQFKVTRQQGTERPFGHIYEEFEKQGEGTYFCVCCGAELFTSTEKFHSGCGWPSFYDSSKAKNVLERTACAEWKRCANAVAPTWAMFSRVRALKHPRTAAFASTALP
jgi:peptide-methionine (R)-S-oxide reductase